MSENCRRQDLPPKGGYKPIAYARMPPKTYLNGIQMIIAYISVTTLGLIGYYQSAKLRNYNEIEMRSARNALFPILVAERDREYLKQLRRNRDEEAQLMAGVKGWKVGTWFGEPIYKTLPKNTLVNPIAKEFYVHTNYKFYAFRNNLKLWS